MTCPFPLSLCGARVSFANAAQGGYQLANGVDVGLIWA
jgi:hypothetical protein